MIAASALRSRHPEVFEFVDSNVHWFRRGFCTAGINDNDPMEHEAYLAFEKLLARPSNQADSAAIRSLVRFVFPAFPEPRVIADIDRQCLARPQGLNIVEPVDYWNRYLKCTPVPDDQSDQRVLRQIRAWKDKGSNDLVSYLIAEDRNGHVEAFLNQFRVSDLLRLLSEVVERERREGVDNWSEFQSPPGGVSIWRMLNRFHVRNSATVATMLEELLQGLLPSHLPYAAFLLDYFCMPAGSTVHPLTGADDTKRLSELARRHLLESFPPGKASALCDALQGANPDLLRSFLAKIRQGCGFTDDLPIEGWERFANTLLELAKLDPLIGIPIILTFITSTQGRIEEPWDEETGERRPAVRVTQYQFQEEVAKKLFDSDRLRSLLQETPIPNDIEEWIREMWRVARDTVRT